MLCKLIPTPGQRGDNLCGQAPGRPGDQMYEVQTHMVVLGELGSNGSDSSRHGVHAGKNFDAIAEHATQPLVSLLCGGSIMSPEFATCPMVATTNVMPSGGHAKYSMWYNHTAQLIQEESQNSLRWCACGFGRWQNHGINGAQGRNPEYTHNQTRAPGPPRVTRGLFKQDTWSPTRFPATCTTLLGFGGPRHRQEHPVWTSP